MTPARRALVLAAMASWLAGAVACEAHVPAYALVEAGGDASDTGADAQPDSASDAPAEAVADAPADAATEGGDAAPPKEAGEGAAADHD